MKKENVRTWEDFFEYVNWYKSHGDTITFKGEWVGNDDDGYYDDGNLTAEMRSECGSLLATFNEKDGLTAY